jgi:hypothetical protein
MAPGGAEESWQLFPLNRGEKLVAPTLQFLGRGSFEREPVPSGQARPVIWPCLFSEPLTNPAVRNVNIIVCDPVAPSWHAYTLPRK